MAEVSSTFRKKPSSLDQLAEQIKLHEGENGAIERTEGRFDPLETQYRLLEKFEVIKP